MTFTQIKINDKGACRRSKTSMGVLHQYRDREYGEGPEGKVSVAEMRDGSLVIAITTTLSPGNRHNKILSFEELRQSIRQSGAFYAIDWQTNTVQLDGMSESLGSIPDDLKHIVTQELQNLLDQFLQTLP